MDMEIDSGTYRGLVQKEEIDSISDCFVGGVEAKKESSSDFFSVYERYVGEVMYYLINGDVL